MGWVLTLTLIGGLGVARALPGRDTVYSDDIVNGQVRSADIATGGVRSVDIADGAVRSADISNGSVGSPDIADGSVKTRDLAANSVGTAKIKDGAIGSADVANNALTGTDIEDGSIGATDLAMDVSGSLLGGRIPSGVTVTGAAALMVTSTIASVFEIAVNLPGDAGKALTDTDVNFKAVGGGKTLDDDPECTGTYDAPIAPSGKVCLYLYEATEDAGNVQGVVPFPGAACTSFVVQWVDNHHSTLPDLVDLKAVWAYTAP